ncbi:hypothetical protein STEG23_011034 [Scotinomys teguina]
MQVNVWVFTSTRYLPFCLPDLMNFYMSTLLLRSSMKYLVTLNTRFPELCLRFGCLWAVQPLGPSSPGDIKGELLLMVPVMCSPGHHVLKAHFLKYFVTTLKKEMTWSSHEEYRAKKNAQSVIMGQYDRSHTTKCCDSSSTISDSSHRKISAFEGYRANCLSGQP